MALSSGTSLGPYLVTAKIGEGGMGEVWQARDTKLDRDVALKVLPEAFTADPDRLARFEREAKVLASLNHPNIGTIYGLEEAEGVKALVLELVEGPTLADRIKQGPIPVDDALPIAKQIAEALEAAHERGVIHRDLKPANIKVTDDGTVKVLDFGLAKALGPESLEASADPDLSPTLTAAATQMGVILGTAAYMAPEQAKGRLVDKRADIWSFGTVLYEMLTGRRPFGGQDVSETLAFVLTRDIDWDTLPDDTPASLRRLLTRCLERDPRERLRDIGEARIALAHAPEAAPEQNTAPPPGALRRWLVPMAAGALLASVATGAAVWTTIGSDAAPARDLRRFVISLTNHRFPATGPGPFLALSPDGRTLVYTGVQDGTIQLYRRPREALESFPIQGTQTARRPFISPDGEWVGFVTGGTSPRCDGCRWPGAHPAPSSRCP